MYGGACILFNKDSIILNARKNEATFKTEKSNEGMEINGVWTIISKDSTYILNEKTPHEDRHGDKKQYVQYFYYYRDTVYGEWYTVINVIQEATKK